MSNEGRSIRPELVAAVEVVGLAMLLLLLFGAATRYPMLGGAIALPLAALALARTV